MVEEEEMVRTITMVGEEDGMAVVPHLPMEMLEVAQDMSIPLQQLQTIHQVVYSIAHTTYQMHKLLQEIKPSNHQQVQLKRDIVVMDMQESPWLNKSSVDFIYTGLPIGSPPSFLLVFLVAFCLQYFIFCEKIKVSKKRGEKIWKQMKKKRMLK